MIKLWTDCFGKKHLRELKNIIKCSEDLFVLVGDHIYLILEKKENMIKEIVVATFENDQISSYISHNEIINYDENGNVKYTRLDNSDNISIYLEPLSSECSDDFRGILSVKKRKLDSKKCLVLQYFHQYNLKEDEYGIKTGHIYKNRVEEPPFRIVWFCDKMRIIDRINPFASAFSFLDYDYCECSMNAVEKSYLEKIYAKHYIINNMSRFTSDRKTISELECELEQKGYDIKVSQKAIDIFNREDSVVKHYQKIVNEVKTVIDVINNKKENNLNLKLIKTNN